MPITLAVWSSEVHVLSPPVNWDRGGQILMAYGCMLAFFLCCAVLYRERNYDGK